MCTAAVPSDGVPGQRVFRIQGRAPIEADPKCVVAPSGSQCSTDCRTIMTCGGVAGPPIAKQTCVNINPKTPYCVKNVCTAIPDLTDDNCKPAFMCQMTGAFPDPSDCTAYHTCPAAGGESILYKCPADTVYNSFTNMCVSRTKYSCNVVDCPKGTMGWVLYKANPAFYAYCTNGPTAEIYMYSCKDTLNEIYDLSIASCRYNCAKAGNFADRTNCNGYYTCKYTSGKWVATKQTCPVGYAFKNGACVSEGGVACVSEIV